MSLGPSKSLLQMTGSLLWQDMGTQVEFKLPEYSLYWDSRNIIITIIIFVTIAHKAPPGTRVLLMQGIG